MKVEITESLAEVAPSDWNRLSGDANPFLRHEFLAGLERHDCLARHGWTPMHVLVRDGSQLVGALPTYLKSNSYGEFVFDWSWAEAYERAGRAYFPKLVNAIPFTPVTGPRLLIDPQTPNHEAIGSALIEGALAHARALRVSSLHCLFPLESELDAFERKAWVRRSGYQYHWHNRDYRDFQDFLDALTSKRRKEIRRERREVERSGIEIDMLTGDQASEQQWRVFHDFYCSTFHRKWGEPRLTLPFFIGVSRALPRHTLLMLARQGENYVAGGFAMLGGDTLYGRHWGCSTHHRQLHFELCYYRTIEYCIEHGLKRLDAGAQGEHKLSRGFLPARTWSMHWLRDPAFGRAVRDFCAREADVVDEYLDGLSQHTPYRQGTV